MTTATLRGVFAAAVTPLLDDFSPDLDQIPIYLGFLAQRGCHGALLLGTTGEGTAFSPSERVAICSAAIKVRQEHPDFMLLAGTGTPSLQETIDLNRAAFDLGFNGVVVLPPYYHRKIKDDGLQTWYSEVIQKSVPQHGLMFAYHIPAVSGIPISIPLLQTLSDQYPDQFAGLKDSSGNPEHAATLGGTFGRKLTVFNGNDRLFSLALDADAAGCITAPANLISPLLRRIWDAFECRNNTAEAQLPVEKARLILDHYPPAAPILKAILARRYHFPLWPVRPPMLPTPMEQVDEALEVLESAGYLE